MKKTKRILSLMLSCTMLAAAVPMSELSVSAATSSVGLKSAVTANVNAKKFTHKEWTGKDYTDLSGRAVTGEDV
ncbi:MAG: hypothetical protein IKC40_03780, partial [Oscillospiraceae bacterium]|nr:hypothetical protein [Oscillospiraceae bacterium]